MRPKLLFLRIAAFSALMGCVVSALPLLSTFSAQETTASQAQVGAPAPDFTLTDTQGKTVKLSDLRKKFVVLEWFDEMCPFVHKHYDSGNMQKLQSDFAKRGVVWISINSSGPGHAGNHTAAEYNQIMKEWKAVPAHFLADPTGAVGHQYGAKTTPDMYLIGKDGTLLYSGAIDDRPDTDVASIKGAKNYLVEAFDAASADKPVAISQTKSYG